MQYFRYGSQTVLVASDIPGIIPVLENVYVYIAQIMKILKNWKILLVLLGSILLKVSTQIIQYMSQESHKAQENGVL